MSNKLRKLKRTRGQQDYDQAMSQAEERLKAMGHLAICVPMYGNPPAAFTTALLDLDTNLKQSHPSYQVLTTNQAYIDMARNDLVKRAFKSGATEILFLDQDMGFPEDLYWRLKAHNVPVVSGLYFLRKPPHNPLIFDWAGTDRVDTFPRLNYEEGLIECGAVGMGATLIQMDAIEAVLAWQMEQGDREKLIAPFLVRPPIGEDIYFAKNCQYAGVKVYCDTTLKLDHIGENEVREVHFKLTSRYGSLEGALERLEQVDGKVKLSDANLALAVDAPVAPRQPEPDGSAPAGRESQEVGAGSRSGG